MTVSRKSVLLAALSMCLLWLAAPASGQLRMGPRLAQSFGNDGARLIEDVGLERALALFSGMSSPFREGDTYLYVLDGEGTIRAHPYANLIGDNILKTKDPDGIPFVREMIMRAAAEPEGFWARYVWLRPSDGRLWKKLVWVRPVNGLLLVAGAYVEPYAR